MNTYQKLLVISFFLSPLIIGFIVLKILQIDKWRRSERILVRIRHADFEIFDDILFQITNFSGFKAFAGIRQNGFLIQKAEILLEPDNDPDYERLKTALNNWC